MSCMLSGSESLERQTGIDMAGTPAVQNRNIYLEIRKTWSQSFDSSYNKAF